MAEERVYTVNLKKAYTAPRNKRARRAITILRKELSRHAKGEVSISPGLNDLIWERGIQKPPRKVKVKVVAEEGEITAMLLDETPPEPGPEQPEPEAAEEAGEEPEQVDEEPEAAEEEETPEEIEEVEEETAEASEDVEEGAEDEGSTPSPEDVVAGTISDAKDAIEEMENPDYEALLEAEKNGKNRKTFISYMEGRIDDNDD